MDENDRWHLPSWTGPRVVTLLVPDVVPGKCVVRFYEAVEIADKRDLYTTEEECMTAAWLRKLSQVQDAMAEADKFKRRADELRKIKGELP